MKRISVTKSVVVALSVFSLLISAPLTVSAEGTRADEARQKLEEKRTEIEKNISERTEAVKNHLTDAKLKICQNRQEAITSGMAHIASRGQKQLELFSTIGERVQNFYTEKGNVLSNYDELVTDMNAKKAAAETAMEDISSASTTFDCKGDDPRGAINAFKESLKTKIQALKEYRTAVRNLVVAVKSVQGASESSADSQGGEQ